MTTSTPSTGDPVVITVTHGAASFWQPHFGNATLPHATIDELVLSTSLIANLIAHLSRGDALAYLLSISLLGPLYIRIFDSGRDELMTAPLQTLNGTGQSGAMGSLGLQHQSLVLL